MTLPVACAQLVCQPFEPAVNRARADEALREATRRGARLVLLPELFATGYAYHRRLRELAEPLDGVTPGWLQRRSRQLGVWIGAGIAEQAGRRVFDSFLLTGPAGAVHVYRKQFPAFFEMLYFHRGQELGVFETALGRIGMLVCWDMVQAKLARALARRIDLLLIVSAWPDLCAGNIPLPGVRHWMTEQPRVRPQRLANQLGVPVIFCNMAGPFVTGVPGLGLTYRTQFAGNSSINVPWHAGSVVLCGEEDILLADVQMVRKQRHHARGLTYHCLA